MGGAMERHEVNATFRRFKPYPEYKDSGVEWLGEIPAHWEVRRLKRLFRVVNGSTPKSDEPAYWDGEIPWATPDDLGKLAARELRSTGRYISREGYESCGTSMVPQGSLLLSTRAPIGHLAIAAVDLCTNQGCRSLVFRTRSDREFFYFELAALRPILESLGDGSTFKELAKQSLEEVAVALPAAPEQRAIATFLDRETASIDELVAKMERLTELLQEKRTALITRAVTKGLPAAAAAQAGLDPNVPMKDTGVEWLGEIPAHWEVMRVRDIAESLQTGPFGSQLHSDEYVVGGTPVINPAHLQDEGIVPDWSSSVDDPTAERLGRHRLSAGDIVFARRGEVGRCALTTWEEEGWLCGTGSLRLRLRADVADPRFFVRMITTGGIRGWLALQSVGSTMQNLNTAIIGRIPVVVPPCSEQVAIADRLDHECERIRQLVGRIDDGIKRLKEFRTALISAAVTGKIDVREPRHSGASRNPVSAKTGPRLPPG